MPLTMASSLNTLRSLSEQARNAENQISQQKTNLKSKMPRPMARYCSISEPSGVLMKKTHVVCQGKRH